MTTTQDVANHLKAHVDFTRFSKLVHALGPQLNTEQLRFLKARILEKSLEQYSNGALKYIATDGCDFELPLLNNIRMEMKFTNGAIFGKKGNMRPNTSIILMNSMGTSKHKELPETYADFLLYVSDYGAILFDKPTLSKYISPNGDGITAKLPTNLGIVVADPTVMAPGKQQAYVDFIKQLDKSVEAYAAQVV